MMMKFTRMWQLVLDGTRIISSFLLLCFTWSMMATSLKLQSSWIHQILMRLHSLNKMLIQDMNMVLKRMVNSDSQINYPWVFLLDIWVQKFILVTMMTMDMATIMMITAMTMVMIMMTTVTTMMATTMTTTMTITAMTMMTMETIMMTTVDMKDTLIMDKKLMLQTGTIVYL